MDKLQKHYYEQNKPDTRVTYDSIHMKFSRDNTNLSQKKKQKKQHLWRELIRKKHKETF